MSRISRDTHHTYLLGLPEHADLRWLRTSIGRWGKHISKDGSPQIGRLALSLSGHIGQLEKLEETGGDKRTYDNVLKHILDDYKGLKAALRPLSALRALSRMLEDVNDSVLKPTGRRASEIRVAARYAG